MIARKDAFQKVRPTCRRFSARGWRGRFGGTLRNGMKRWVPAADRVMAVNMTMPDTAP